MARNPKTRASGQWTEARFFGFIRSSLRAASSRWIPRIEAKKAARTGRNQYTCACCGETFGNKDVELNHIIPVGSLKTFEDLSGFAERLFCEQDGFEVLCKPCHLKKTKEDS